jgi:lysophospholipase L1-like esterase
MQIKLTRFYSRFIYNFQSLRHSYLSLLAMRLLLCALIILCASNPGHSKERPAKAKKWVGTWGTALQLVDRNNMPPAPGLSNNTIRQVVCVSIGGKKLQLKFSNKFGQSPMTMKSVQLAVSKGGAAIDEATTKTVTFNGRSEITLDPGAEVTSDAVSFDLKQRMEVAITIAFGETSSTLTGHPSSRTTSYLLTGNQTGPNTDFANAVKTNHWYVIMGIDVESPKPAVVAILGDSITDGVGSGNNKQNRWPDIFSMRLLENRRTRKIGVLNMGIGGNTILRGGVGPTALTRFDHDVLNQPGVRWVVIFEGINDLGSTRDSAAAFNVAKGLIAAYDTMINKAHAHSMKVYGVTITPVKKSFYYTTYKDAARNFVNEWIRTSGHFDAVIDFDKTIRDPQDGATILAEAQSDYLHPNELGYQMMGKAVDISLFK